MVRWMRSVRIAGAKNTLAAMQFAKDIAEFAQKYEGVTSIGVYMDSFGEMGTIRWFIDYDDLATLEKTMSQMLNDQEYFQKISKASDLLIEGSVHDVVMRAI